MEQCCQFPVAQIKTNHKHIYESKTPAAEVTGMESNSGGFDCNICLDSVQDPVVTLCGHLYCWPCIYMWMHSKGTKPHDPDQLPKCPVCKTGVSENTLIPLYGRGHSGKPSGSKATQLGLVIPHRPCGKRAFRPLIEEGSSTSPHSHNNRQLHYHGGYPHHEEGHLDYSLDSYTRSHAFGFAGTTTFYPVIGMFGEMIHARLSRNPETTLYTDLNTYGAASTGGASTGRQAMQAERSLSRVSFFLFCCTIVCLLLF